MTRKCPKTVSKTPENKRREETPNNLEIVQALTKSNNKLPTDLPKILDSSL